MSEDEEETEEVEETKEVEETEEEVEETEEEETEETEEEEEVYEIVINSHTYYTTNEQNGIIYDIDSENGDISIKKGQYVNGVPKWIE